ncbi:MAG: FHA domain-containing protein [Pseudomonadota bacterium]
MKFLSDMISKRKQEEEEGAGTPHAEDVADFPLPEFSASGEASALAPAEPVAAAPQVAPQPEHEPEPEPAPEPEAEAGDESYDWDIEGLDLSPDPVDDPAEATDALDVPAKSVSFEDTLVSPSEDPDVFEEAEGVPEATAPDAISDVERRLRASIARLPGEDEGAPEAPEVAPTSPAARRSSFIAQSVRNKMSRAEDEEPTSAEEAVGEAEDPDTLFVETEMEDDEPEEVFEEDYAEAEDEVEAEDDGFEDDGFEDDGQETLEEAIEVLEEASAEFDDVEAEAEDDIDEDEAVAEDVAEVEEEDDDEDDLDEAEAYSPLEQLRAMREEARAGSGADQGQSVDASQGMNALASFFATDADDGDEAASEAFEDEMDNDLQVAADASGDTAADMTATESDAAPTAEENDTMAEVAVGPDPDDMAASDDLDDDPEIDAIAAPRRRAGGRVKTRLLGFHKPDEANADPISAAKAKEADTRFAVGWIVVVKGPGRGASFTLNSGASTIGRGDDQTVRLDFGDTSISRENHAVVAYDDEQKRFFIGHGGKANLVRLNDMPVLSTEPLHHGNIIRIGETSLMFVALCGDDFSWTDGPFAESSHAAE